MTRQGLSLKQIEHKLPKLKFIFTFLSLLKNRYYLSWKNWTLLRISIANLGLMLSLCLWITWWMHATWSVDRASEELDLLCINKSVLGPAHYWQTEEACWVSSGEENCRILRGEQDQMSKSPRGRTDVRRTGMEYYHLLLNCLGHTADVDIHRPTVPVCQQPT